MNKKEICFRCGCESSATIELAEGTMCVDCYLDEYVRNEKNFDK